MNKHLTSSYLLFLVNELPEALRERFWLWLCSYSQNEACNAEKFQVWILAGDTHAKSFDILFQIFWLRLNNKQQGEFFDG